MGVPFVRHHVYIPKVRDKHRNGETNVGKCRAKIREGDVCRGITEIIKRLLRDIVNSKI